MKKQASILWVFTITVLFACNIGQHNNEVDKENTIAAPTSLSYDLVKVYAHDTSAYTQGLEWNGNKLIEGTGLEGKSILQILDSNMKPIGSKIKLDKEYFGEGTTLFKDKIYQLTWKSHKVFVYDVKTLKKINELYWPYEGWGLSHNDTSLIVSTGESNIYFVDPIHFSIQKTLGVFNQYGYLSNINELEYVNGQLFANIYGRNEVVVIDALTGQVKNTVDFSNLLSQAGVKYDPISIDAGYVLNGIAYHAGKKTFFITGKCWPVIVEIRLH
jgi:glutaminyl-peptide cyclotransferase